MQTLRQQFDYQCDRAKKTSEFYRRELHVVLVYHKGFTTRISILGNAISMGAYVHWRKDGSKVKLLRAYDQNGEICFPPNIEEK